MVLVEGKSILSTMLEKVLNFFFLSAKKGE